jgi:uncharacterized protein (TIGR02231 family)
MKKIILIASIIATHISIHGAEPIEVKSKIKAVTVFINGAQVYREARVNIKTGTNKVVIDDVSPYINTKSLQASISSGALILDVKHNIVYNQPEIAFEPIPEKILTQISALEDSLLYRNFGLQKIRNQINNLETEKRIITNNKTIKGEGKSDSLAIFMQAVEFYQSKLNEIEGWLYDYKIQEHKLTKGYSKIEIDLQKLRNFSTHKTIEPTKKEKVHQVILTVDASASAEAKVKINYLVTRAGWRPSYDLRAEGDDTPVNLTYKASIYQKTGEDWDNVDLTLSTFHQDCSFSVPELAPWKIIDKATSYNRSQQVLGYQSTNSDTVSLIQNGYSNVNFYSNTLSNTTTATFNTASSGSNGVTLGAFNATNNNQFIIPQSLVSNTDKTLSNVEFNIDRKYHIPADGEEILMVIDNIDLTSSYNYISIPKVNTDAFLLTNITNWTALNLLPAKANIYFANSFVGETTIDPSSLKDTLIIALGREKGIQTSRKKIEDDEKSKLVGKNISREITIELVVKNNMNRGTDFVLKDQIPVSENDDIKVKVIEDANASIDKNTGIMTWNLKLKPKEQRIVKFTYQITHDKEIDVI